MNNFILTSNKHLLLTFARQLSSNSAAICKIHRSVYAQKYLTKVVQSDGSSIITRYHEPRRIIKLPLNLNEVPEAVKKFRLEARKPKKAINMQNYVEDEYNSRKYLKYIKKRK